MNSGGAKTHRAGHEGGDDNWLQQTGYRMGRDEDGEVIYKEVGASGGADPGWLVEQFFERAPRVIVTSR